MAFLNSSKAMGSPISVILTFPLVGAAVLPLLPPREGGVRGASIQLSFPSPSPKGRGNYGSPFDSVILLVRHRHGLCSWVHLRQECLTPLHALREDALDGPRLVVAGVDARRVAPVPDRLDSL